MAPLKEGGTRETLGAGDVLLLGQCASDQDRWTPCISTSSRKRGFVCVQRMQTKVKSTPSTPPCLWWRPTSDMFVLLI